MRTKKQRLILAEVQENDDIVTPTYYFDFNLLNNLGFPDEYIFDFIKEMKAMAKKKIRERANNSFK